MAQKMTLTGYLAQRGTKAKALTKGEAALLGIPYPLRAGWPRRHGAMEIDEMMLEQLAVCAEVARQASEGRMRHNQVKTRRSILVDAPTPKASEAPVRILMSAVPGFVLRRARRFRARNSAPWA
jgi:hypothetical protein